MPGIGPQCHELRVNDAGRTWRIMYHLDPGAVVIPDVFAKKTPTTLHSAIQTCRRRLAAYWRVTRGAED